MAALKDIEITEVTGANGTSSVNLKKFDKFAESEVGRVISIQKYLEELINIVKGAVLNQDVWYDDLAVKFAKNSWNNQEGNHYEGLQSIYTINKIAVGLNEVVVAKMCHCLRNSEFAKETAANYPYVRAFEDGTFAGKTVGNYHIKKYTIRYFSEKGNIDIKKFDGKNIAINPGAINTFLGNFKSTLDKINSEVNDMSTDISNSIFEGPRAILTFKGGLDRKILRGKIQMIKNAMGELTTKLYIPLSTKAMDSGKGIDGLKTLLETDWANEGVNAFPK